MFLIATPMMVYFMLFAKEGVSFLSGDAYAGAAISTLAAEVAVFIVQYIALRDIINKAYQQVRYITIASSVLVGGILAVLIKRMQMGSFITLCVSTIVYFGIYFLILTIAKDPLVIEIENQLLGKIIEKKQ